MDPNGEIDRVEEPTPGKWEIVRLKSGWTLAKGEERIVTTHGDPIALTNRASAETFLNMVERGDWLKRAWLYGRAA